jgi:hypothetical protein
MVFLTTSCWDIGPDLETMKGTKKSTQTFPIFTKKENATLAHRIKILDWHDKNGKNQSATAWHFGPLL